jgi:ribosomal protein S18 acetylase RimI-like enzyme
MVTLDDDLLSRIEDASLNASAPPQQRWLDGWIVRYAPGKARRARCVNAVAAGRLPLPQKLQQVSELFAAADLPLVVRITRFTQPPQLDAELAALGYQQEGLTCVLAKPGLRASQPEPLPSGLHWAELDLETFADAVGRLRGSPPAHRQSHATRMGQSPVPVKAFAIRRDGSLEVMACGQFTQEAEVVGLYDVFTHESLRGQGLASHLCERMLSISANSGADIGYLQVEASNHPARLVYARLGFQDGYKYHYREPAAAL